MSAYDDGYRSCACFWGREPSSLVRELAALLGSFGGLDVLDAGCGEGKNAQFVAALGGRVRAIDISSPALTNARATWDATTVEWELGDVRSVRLGKAAYDLVIAYGLLHCLGSRAEIAAAIERLKDATRVGGYHLLCSFNDRSQDLTAHPGFTPTLLTHEEYIGFYAGWTLLTASDSDLTEVHPHNGIEHTHSMTRIVAKRSP